MKVQTYDTEGVVTSLEELREHIAASRSGPYGCCLLFGEDDRSLFAYWNDDLAALFFFDGPEDDVGCTANAPFELAGADVETFRIENGQVDEYPRSITCRRAAAIEALEEFYVTGRRPEGLPWFEN